MVGGGIAGLAAAWRLVGAGVRDVRLLELESSLGGTARSGRSPLGAYPWGAHYITAPMKDSRALIRLLGEMSVFEGETAEGEPVVAEQYLCRDPKERVFFLGRWYEGLFLHAGASDQDEAQYKAFEAEIGRLAEWRDSRGRRAFALPSSQCSDHAELVALDRISMSQWLDTRGFTSPRLRWYVDYACRDDYGLRLADTSAWAGLQYYAARVQKRGSDYQPVITWPEGNGRLVTHLARGLGERIRTGWAVADIRPVEEPGGRRYLELVALTDSGQRAVGMRAQQVVFAAPQFLAGYLIHDYRERRPDHLSAFEYGPWMVANLTLRRRPQWLGFELSWDNVLYDSPSLSSVVSTHQRALDHGPTVITYYYPLLDADARVGRRRLLQTDYAGWADVALSDLEQAHPDIRHLTERIEIMRWGHAMIRPRPGFIWGRDRQRALQPYRGVHFAHSDLGGIALFEEALDHGVRAAEEVLVARGVEQASWR